MSESLFHTSDKEKINFLKTLVNVCGKPSVSNGAIINYTLGVCDFLCYFGKNCIREHCCYFHTGSTPCMYIDRYCCPNSILCSHIHNDDCDVRYILMVNIDDSDAYLTPIPRDKNMNLIYNQ